MNAGLSADVLRCICVSRFVCHWVSPFSLRTFLELAIPNFVSSAGRDDKDNLAASVLIRLSYLLLPPAPEGAVDLHHSLKFAEIGLSQRQLRRKKPCIAIEHLEITRGATFVAHRRKLCCLFGRVCQLLLLGTKLPILLVFDERIRNVSKSLL